MQKAMTVPNNVLLIFEGVSCISLDPESMLRE